MIKLAVRCEFFLYQENDAAFIQLIFVRFIVHMFIAICSLQSDEYTTKNHHLIERREAMKFEKSIPDRKVLVRRLEALTGIKARYTYVPRCAYEIGAFTVEMDGSLTVTDGADLEVIETLKEEKMIGNEISDGNALGATRLKYQPVERNCQIGVESWEPEAGVGVGASQDAPAVWQPDTDLFSEIALPEEEAADAIQESSGDETEASDPAAPFPIDASISFPLSKHSAKSLQNLICLVYSRGELLSKSTGGRFYASKQFVDDLLDGHNLRTAEEVIAFIRGWDGLSEPLFGISFTDDKVVFDGFTSVPDEGYVQTFTRLAAAMNKMAITQNHIQAKEVDAENEKYALRIWLIRLGFSGNEYKEDRKRLMANLSGHTAFRTEEEKNRAKAKAQRKRDELRAAKASQNK